MSLQQDLFYILLTWSVLFQGPMSDLNRDRRGAQFCPKIESDERFDAYMVLNGESMQVEAFARNFAVSG